MSIVVYLIVGLKMLQVVDTLGVFVLTAHDSGGVAQVTQDVLQRALAQCDPHGEGEAPGVHLLITLPVQQPAPGGVQLWGASDALQTNGGEQSCPHRGVVVGNIRLVRSAHVPSVALNFILLLGICTKACH